MFSREVIPPTEVDRNSVFKTGGSKVGLDCFLQLKDVLYNYIAQEMSMQNFMEQQENIDLFFYNLGMEIILCIYTTYYTEGKSLKLLCICPQVRYFIGWICSSDKAV